MEVSLAAKGEKVAAAVLTAELLRRGITAHSVDNAVRLYHEVLKHIRERQQPNIKCKPTEQSS